ncbi:PREDICTED: YTH domain-containing family protein 3-like isoform X1 [Nicotiana attenuata]|uniref:YTH domain-containing family protein n=1 Tax=Nicotiana attenuata TaxID=49451 RepID=A0A1J6J0Z0_NICAT|nr:PREDICTED: YTH domain-containing family protein 3-like isoform X1 [Nicotiana attenuata]OIT03567.1 30-kda cleavage and polyadenylation specificity factor 30 [Nicotiana attenuata]
MEDTNQQNVDRFTSVSSSGERAVEPHNAAEQPISPKDERIVSANASANATIPGAARNAKDHPVTSETGALSTFYPLNSYSPQDQGFYYGGYDNGTGSWAEQSNDVNLNNLHVVPPAMYNENPLFFPPGYGFDAQMAFGQFSPIASPLSPFMIDGQLYSPHQIPVSPNYYAPPISPGLPHVTSALPASQPDLVAPGSTGHEIDSTYFGPGSGYYIPVGSFGGGELSGSSNIGFYNYQGEFGSGQSLSNRPNPVDSGRYMSQMTSAALYPQPVGILGPYEQYAMQASHQGLGFTQGSSARHYSQGNPYPSANYGTGSSSQWEPGHRNWLTPDRGGRRERDRHSVNISTESLGMASERNRGPRALKPKSKGPIEDSSSSVIHKEVESTNTLQPEQYNRPEFVTDYEHAKFFVIKSFSEDNVHKSIKYSVWASTPLGNRKLDAAYREAKERNADCPVFLFFSVNASGQFCGVAEMVGPVDFENNAEHWQQDRWSGQFPVKWHVIKDVPNSQFRHLLLEHNDNKPVTHSRDSQEVKLPEGLEMLKIFKNYEADTSILDDFTYYDEKEKSLLEKKSKQRTLQPGSAAVTTAADTISQLADSLAGTLNLESNKNLP